MKRFWSILHSFKRTDRGSFRSRRIMMSVASVLGAKVINLLVVLITTPLTFTYLGEERFGLYMVVLSMIMFFNFADLGLGYGLFNRIARYEVTGDQDSLQKAISSTFIFLVGISVLILAFFFVSDQWLAWDKILNLSLTDEGREAENSMRMFVVCFCAVLPFTIVLRVQLGYQENHVNQLWEGIGNLMSLCLIILSVYYKASVPLLILAHYGSQCGAILLNFVFKFLIRRQDLCPRIVKWDFRIFKEIFYEARMIFALQVSNVVLNSIDSILISRYWGPAAVGVYAVGYRLYSIINLPLQAFLNSILPGFNDAMAAHDSEWITRKSKKTFMGVLMISCIMGVSFILLANIILPIWIMPGTKLELPLLIAFGVYIAYQNLNTLLFNIMMSPAFLKRLFVLFSFASGIVLVLKLTTIQHLHYSVLLWSTILGSAVFFLLPGYRYLRNQLDKMKWEKDIAVHSSSPL